MSRKNLVSDFLLPRGQNAPCQSDCSILKLATLILCMSMKIQKDVKLNYRNKVDILDEDTSSGKLNVDLIILIQLCFLSYGRKWYWSTIFNYPLIFGLS